MAKTVRVKAAVAGLLPMSHRPLHWTVRNSMAGQIMVCTYYNFVCQLHLNEVGKKGKKPHDCYTCICCGLVTKQCLTLITPWAVAHFRLLCPWDLPGKNIGACCRFSSPWDLPTPGIEPAYPVLAGGYFLPLRHQEATRVMQVLVNHSCIHSFVDSPCARHWGYRVNYSVIYYDAFVIVAKTRTRLSCNIAQRQRYAQGITEL